MTLTPPPPLNKGEPSFFFLHLATFLRDRKAGSAPRASGDVHPLNPPKGIINQRNSGHDFYAYPYPMKALHVSPLSHYGPGSTHYIRLKTPRCEINQKKDTSSTDISVPITHVPKI